MSNRSRQTKLIATTALCLATALLATGCSSELASTADVYVPASVDESYPIKVVDRPVKLTVETDKSGLRKSDVSSVGSFAKEAAASSSPVVISYPSGSKTARKGAEQASAILARGGVARHLLVLTPEKTQGHSITMTFVKKVAETRECGDWSQNMRANQRNDSGPNFGCAYQQNMAAMIANPEDIVKPRPMTPAQSAAQDPALTAYQNGEWTTPTVDSTF